jgi:hypothetical protein
MLEISFEDIKDEDDDAVLRKNNAGRGVLNYELRT